MKDEMKWRGVGITDVGLVRPSNQDTFSVSNELGLWIVADGMGGHAGGHIASALAVESIQIYVRQYLAKLADDSTTLDWEEILQSAIAHANKTIRGHAEANPQVRGMGTTVVLIFIPQIPSEQAIIAHAGDSRAYLIRDQTITSLTRDHTLLEERIQVGLLPRSTPTSHQLGHVLTRAVGVESRLELDVSSIQLRPTDEVLLCSDGLIKMLSDEEILAVLLETAGATPRTQCQALVDKANQLGGKDNITVALITKEAD